METIMAWLAPVVALLALLPAGGQRRDGDS